MKTNLRGKLVKEKILTKKQEIAWITKLVGDLKAGNYLYKGCCKDGLGSDKFVLEKSSNGGVIVFTEIGHDGKPKISYSTGKRTSYNFKQESDEDVFLYKSLTYLLIKTIRRNVYGEAFPGEIKGNFLPFVPKQVKGAN